MNYAISHFVLFVLTINEDFLGILKKKLNIRTGVL